MAEKYRNNPSQGAFSTQKMERLTMDDYVQYSQRQVRDIFKQVCEALEEKGYNPVNQLTGYILSGDPTYITSYKDARKIIGRVERDELLEELVQFYLHKLFQE